MILDVLSRLQVDVKTNNKIDILKALHKLFIKLYISDLTIVVLDEESIYYIILIKIINDFKQRLK